MRMSSLRKRHFSAFLSGAVLSMSLPSHELVSCSMCSRSGLLASGCRDIDISLLTIGVSLMMSRAWLC